ncbi:MAG: c-type cytochrome domain-containing protein [Woeseiaceae bacterium]
MYAKLLFGAAVFTLATQISGCGRSEVSFAADVQPIFNDRCLECHKGVGDGEGAVASNFSVVDYAAVMKGTGFGPVVIPGSSISSTLYLVVAGKTSPEIRMPPHHEESLAEGRGESLNAEELETIAAWIDQGAKDN